VAVEQDSDPYCGNDSDGGISPFVVSVDNSPFGKNHLSELFKTFREILKLV